MSASLLVDGVGIWAFTHELDKGEKLLIGRSPKAGLRLTDGSTSGEHAEITFNGEKWLLKDLQSRNGTTLNSKKVEESFLKNGDIITIGNIDMVFKSRTDSVEERDMTTTRCLIQDHAKAMKEALETAGPGKEVKVPDLHFPEYDQPLPAPPTPVAQERREQSDADLLGGPTFETFDLPKSAKSVVDQDDMRPEDRLWIAEVLADILSQLASLQSAGKKQVYKRGLELLRHYLQAENGFLMVPSAQHQKWVIVSWVGDADEWTAYEKSRPVPLSIANKAYTEDKVLTTARKGVPLEAESVSMLQLQVKHYIAVPLKLHDKNEGLLYFDTRRNEEAKPFLPRHVRLIERVGAYFVEMVHSLEGKEF